jgi:hypothetical protein
VLPGATNLVGTLPTWLAFLVLAVIGYYVVRGAGGQALSITQQANQVLSREVEKLQTEARRTQQVVAHLEAKRSLEPIVVAVVDQFAHHEERAHERHLALLEYLRSSTEQAEERHKAMLGAYSQLGAAVTQGIHDVVEGNGP